LRHERIKLARLQHLGQGPQGKPEHSHRGAQLEGLLQSPGRLHFVVAQPDPETAQIAASGGPAAPGGFIWMPLAAGKVGVVGHDHCPPSAASVAHRPQGWELMGDDVSWTEGTGTRPNLS
jgi:hypothetical protein